MDSPHLAKRTVSRIRREWRNFRNIAISKLLALKTRYFWRMRVRQRPHQLPGELIVSLTSYPARFKTLGLTLRCLLSQTVKANRTILWIANADASLLPADVLTLQQYGLEVRLTEDIGPYKKIIPALLAFPKAFIVTADDDEFYEDVWLESLVTSWDGRINQVVCHRAHRITIDDCGRPRAYRQWVLDTKDPQESTSLFPTGSRGVLYPPGSLASDVTDQATFLRLCPKGDDIWLYWMGRRAGTSYKLVNVHYPEVEWPGSQHVSLFSHNYLSGNDEQIRNLGAELGYPKLDES
jgi:hypothetical protein